MNSMIEARQLEKVYQMDGEKITVLNGLDLTVEPGESLAVVGPSGAGKSTLLNLLAGLDEPTGGQIVFEGRPLGAVSQAERAILRNRKVGFIFQSYQLLPELTALENVQVPIWVGRGLAEEDEARARELLRRVGLAERMEHKPGQLSGGEQQRVAVARALANRPAYVFADEPTGNLDHAMGKNLLDLLLNLCEEHRVTLVLVTHDQELARRMKRRLRLEKGKLAKIS